MNTNHAQQYTWMPLGNTCDINLHFQLHVQDFQTNSARSLLLISCCLNFKWPPSLRTFRMLILLYFQTCQFLSSHFFLLLLLTEKGQAICGCKSYSILGVLMPGASTANAFGCCGFLALPCYNQMVRQIFDERSNKQCKCFDRTLECFSETFKHF